MGISIGGTASAWFAGPSRVPFVAGLNRALPAALGRIHPRWRSPYVALTTCAVFAAAFTCWSLVGSGVAEAYQVLLKSSVVLQLIPFVYMFAAVIKLDSVAFSVRAITIVGALATVIGIIVAFVPTPDVTSVLTFELKMAIGIAAPIAVGAVLFLRSQRRLHESCRE